MTTDVILKVDDLHVSFTNDDDTVEVLHGVNLSVYAGRTLGLVGESGSGKSVTAMSIMGLLPQPYGQITQGSIMYRGIDTVTLPAKQLWQMRGNRISIIFQDPMTALNPVHTIRSQLYEILELHRPELNKKARHAVALEMLEKVRIPLPEKRLDEYPHNLSGGMRQRVMIAMALACKPDILICDEPTTALDVTVQASILDLMNDLQAETGMAMIFITHDLGVVAEVCDDVAVMYNGKIVEYAEIFELFDFPKHPYTEKLLGLMPSLDSAPKQRIDIKTLPDDAFIES
ncbi:ABC transporter ATP-binding protein [Vibrio palustris]|uniref:ABC-type dipeptide transporter n=1 Tax=Vibrio palustris TaxID=1918946 RepID=A0A1R4B2Q1_9VIBR|nr:ABC transporter ATP-binding protein [Vibrio palustris]SJL83188.1 Oligopeptide transport ATP-binding protein OppD [Vibrio palustris]